MIKIGTSGFKFDDWKGTFYPVGLAANKWLEYYAERFDTVEVNASYYKLLHPATFFQMAKKVPEGFEFTVKAYRTLTHEIGEDTHADLQQFIASVEPLVEAKKFGCILAQFPTSFQHSAEAEQYVERFANAFGAMPLVVEFRHRSWATDAVLDFLRARRIGYCAVDEPQFRSLMPPVAVATSPIGYVRFHGRNYEQWWKGDSKKRYDYLYSEEELKEWVPKLERLDDQTDKVYVFMNNCFAGQAATNAGQLRQMLQQRLAQW
jgi:uncharacterized protein YecE (DUF72 family)